jgi:hypothetical protein
MALFGRGQARTSSATIPDTIKNRRAVPSYNGNDGQQSEDTPEHGVAFVRAAREFLSGNGDDCDHRSADRIK